MLLYYCKCALCKGAAASKAQGGPDDECCTGQVIQMADHLRTVEFHDLVWTHVVIDLMF